MHERYANPFDSDPLISAASKKAEILLARDEIKTSDFADLYGADNVEKDEEYVRHCEATFLQQERGNPNHTLKLARVFEAVIHEQGEQSDWFGPDATTIKASRYDDLKNGVDTIIEFQEDRKPASQLALALDVTYSNELKRKFDRIKGEIERGELTRIKYFHSEKTGFRGEMTKVPRIIIGADQMSVKGVASLWLDGKNASLATHPIQFQILEEARLQCEAFGKYAAKLGHADVAAKYENDLHIVEAILAKKAKTIRDVGDRDRVFQEIKAYTEASHFWRPEK